MRLPSLKPLTAAALLGCCCCTRAAPLRSLTATAPLAVRLADWKANGCGTVCKLRGVAGAGGAATRAIERTATGVLLALQLPLADDNGSGSMCERVSE